MVLENSTTRLGSIKQICVQNFVTFDNASITPGPNLNLLIGPNGSGKSTFIAAIILGLGGSPKHVGRGTRISEYVKHGFSEAKIHIALYNTSDQVTITREFNSDNKNLWKINDTKVTINDIIKLKKKFNIEVDNLCQFLPQDRVQEFSKLNKQELLKQTLSNLGREDITNKQEELIRVSDEFKNLNKNVEADREELQNAKNSNLQIDDLVKNIEKKKKLLDYIKGVDRKIAWIEYESLAVKKTEMKTDRDYAKATLTAQRNSIVSIENDISTRKEDVQKYEQKRQHINKGVVKIEGEIEKIMERTGAIREDILNHKNQLQSRLKRIENHERELKEIDEKIAVSVRQKEEIVSVHGNVDKIKSCIEDHRANIRKLTEQSTELEGQKMQIGNNKRNKLFEQQNLERQLSAIRDSKQRRLEFLRTYDPGTYEAVQWLRQNPMDFIGKVYEPMILELNITDPKYSVYMENIVAKRDKLAFFCTVTEDMNRLIKVMRFERKFNINVIHSDERDHESEPRRQTSIEELRKYGFFAYVNQFVSGPISIMKYLYKNYKIHEIPIGTTAVDNLYDQVSVKLFFSDQWRYSCSVSKYSGQRSTMQSKIHSDKTFSILMDLEKSKEIDISLEKCKQEYGKLVNLEETILQKIKKLEELADKETDHADSLRAALAKIRAAEAHHADLTRARAERATVEDRAAVEEAAGRAVRDLVAEAAAAQAPLRAKCDDVAQLALLRRAVDERVAFARGEVARRENEAADARRARAAAERAIAELSRRLAALVAEANEALNRGRELSDGLTPADDGFERFREYYDRLPDAVEELEREKDTIFSKVNRLKVPGENELHRYERRLVRIAELEAKLNSTADDTERRTLRLSSLKREYVAALDTLIAEIDARFSAAYTRMGCSGNVRLYKGEGVDRAEEAAEDFRQYGIAISVAYRADEPQRELRAGTQSGGEKAVATATYLLALQELTPAPFRCLDEINQGMDEVNERRVFRMLGELTSSGETPQYFLVTPKLIPNLNYDPSMVIHCIYSGPFIDI